MIEKSLARLTATRLRLMLIVSIVGILAIIGIGFYFLQGYLYAFSVNVSHVNEDASTSVNDVATLQKLQKQLQDDQATIDRAKKIVADSKSYQYQNQIINDLNTYASRTGVSIGSFTFDSGAKTGGSASAGPASSAASGGATVSPISGLKSTIVAVTLTTPTKYNNLMQFIHSIEQNLTKMQLASLSLSKGTTNDTVSVSTLELEVYVK